MFNDFWMVDNGFIQRPIYGDIRDLIARRHLEKEDFCLTPTIPVAQAIKRMRMYSISQMAVVDERDHVVGILDETDVLMALVRDRDCANKPIRDFMTSRVETVRPTASVNDLVPIFRADRIAVVSDEKHFYGLITKIDLINYLRKQL
jgi:cystathionine beta-synthase